MRSTVIFVVGLACVALTASAADTAYPMRPIRLVVGYPAGGATDIAARLIAQKLAPALAPSNVVDNSAGASGIETETRRWLKVAQDAGIKPE